MSGNVVCKHCGSNNVFGMSRVVGYYSIIENWNDSKKAELVDRQKGQYQIEEETVSVCLDSPREEISNIAVVR